MTDGTFPRFSVTTLLPTRHARMTGYVPSVTWFVTQTSGATGSATVGEWFSEHPGSEALSQYNGSAIFIVSNEWAPYDLGLFNGNFYTAEGPSSYALGTMMHELLHKQTVGGGFTHGQFDDALNAIGAYSRPPGTNGDSASLANICF